MAESSDPGLENARAIRDNNDLWDAWTAIHATSEFYDLEGFKAGGVRLSDEEIADIGPVEGRDLLHLQCHFGIDTLSWARLGARVTGADFSAAAVELARSLAVELGFPEARFVRSDLYDLPNVLEGDFDVVYTSRGVLGWLPDIRRWAEVVAHFVRPGGTFYINEIHPVAQAFENEGVAPGELRLAYPYWEHERAADLPGQGLVCRPDRRRGGRGRARLGPWPRRDRQRAHRRRAADREPARVPVGRIGSSTSSSRALTSAGACPPIRPASCPCPSRSGRRGRRPRRRGPTPSADGAPPRPADRARDGHSVRQADRLGRRLGQGCR